MCVCAFFIFIFISPATLVLCCYEFCDDVHMFGIIYHLVCVRAWFTVALLLLLLCCHCYECVHIVAAHAHAHLLLSGQCHITMQRHELLSNILQYYAFSLVSFSLIHFLHSHAFWQQCAFIDISTSIIGK